MAKHENQIFIDASVGKLEASYYAGDSQKPIVLICHPHSLMGGTMHNKVVTTIARTFQLLDYATIRFNFRGVGLSSGIFDAGKGEQQDVADVVTWALAHLGTRPVILVGFSFGSYVAIQYAQHHALASLILVAPPVRMPNYEHLFDKLELPDCPAYLIVAEADEVVSTPNILAWANQQAFKAILNVPEASHFFHGRLLTIRDFLLEHFH